jgi:hypothetical protein
MSLRFQSTLFPMMISPELGSSISSPLPDALGAFTEPQIWIDHVLVGVFCKFRHAFKNTVKPTLNTQVVDLQTPIAGQSLALIHHSYSAEHLCEERY